MNNEDFGVEISKMYNLITNDSRRTVDDISRLYEKINSVTDKVNNLEAKLNCALMEIKLQDKRHDETIEAVSSLRAKFSNITAQIFLLTMPLVVISLYMMYKIVLVK